MVQKETQVLYKRCYHYKLSTFSYGLLHMNTPVIANQQFINATSL